MDIKTKQHFKVLDGLRGIAAIIRPARQDGEARIFQTA